MLASLGQAQAPADVEAEAISAQVRYGDGRSSESVTLKRLAPESDEWFIAGSDLADILQVGRYWRFDVRKLVLRIDGSRITFTVGARSVVGGERTILLRQEVRFDNGEPWIPLEFLREVLPQLSERAVAWDPDENRLSLGEQSYNVTSLGIQTDGLVTEVRIQMSSALAFRVDDSRPRQLFLKIYGGRVDRGALRLGRARGLIESVSFSQVIQPARRRVDQVAHSWPPIGICGTEHGSQKPQRPARKTAKLVEFAQPAVIPRVSAEQLVRSDPRQRHL